MIEQLLLETEGYRFSFDIDYARTNREYLGMVVSFEPLLVPPLTEMTLHSQRTSISLADLRRLKTYFEHHMGQMKEKDGDVESYVFLNWELGFKLQALSGDVELPDDGNFSIICLVNVGNAHDETCVYMGGESGITFGQVQGFLQDIQTFLDEAPSLDPDGPPQGLLTSDEED